MSRGVDNWKKRLRRKGPFYLQEVEDFQNQYGHRVDSEWRVDTRPAKRYWVIWNDGPKTKIGALEDYMYCRYGIATRAVLNGDSMLDMWNGQGLTEKDFEDILAVRRGVSELREFDLDELVGLVH